MLLLLAAIAGKEEVARGLGRVWRLSLASQGGTQRMGSLIFTTQQKEKIMKNELVRKALEMYLTLEVSEIYFQKTQQICLT